MQVYGESIFGNPVYANDARVPTQSIQPVFVPPEAPKAITVAGPANPLPVISADPRPIPIAGTSVGPALVPMAPAAGAAAMVRARPHYYGKSIFGAGVDGLGSFGATGPSMFLVSPDGSVTIDPATGRAMLNPAWVALHPEGVPKVRIPTRSGATFGPASAASTGDSNTMLYVGIGAAALLIGGAIWWKKSKRGGALVPATA